MSLEPGPDATTLERFPLEQAMSDVPSDASESMGDLEGAAGILRHLGTVIPLLKFLTTEVEAHFPEIVGHIILFNAPRIVSSIFPMIKAFMDPITAAKVEIYSGVPTERLLAILPSSAIPTEYGGTSTAPYPLTRILSAEHVEYN